MSGADTLIYEQATTTEMEDKPFIRKDWGFCNDTSNGAYGSGNIIINTESTLNSDYINWSEAYFQFPCYMVASGLTNASSTTKLLLGIKNGHWQLIHRLSVTYNGSTLFSPLDYTNMLISYMVASKFSLNDCQILGPSLGFALDSHDSWCFPLTDSTAPTRSPFGQGSCNNSNYINRIVNSAVGAVGIQQLNNGNIGFATRQGWLNNPFVSTGTEDLTLYGGNNLLTDDNRTNTLGPKITYNATNTAICIEYQAIIRLKDLPSDFFAKCPPLKSANFRFSFNVNNCNFVVTKQKGAGGTNAFGPTMICTANDPDLRLTTPPSSPTCPIMIASCYGSTAGLGSAGVGIPAAGDTVITCSFNVGAVVYPAHKSIFDYKGLNGCRLYYPWYIMNPFRQEEYLSQGTYTFSYTDVIVYPIQGVFPNQSVVREVTAGIVNLQKVIMIPHISATANADCGVSPIQSPFASEPATTAPIGYGGLRELNVSIANMNLLQQNVTYGYETYLHNVLAAESLNGSVTTGLSAGLINHDMWLNNYNYYVFDVSRRVKEQDNDSKAVRALFVNNTKVSLDVYVFLVSECEFKVDLARSPGPLVTAPLKPPKAKLLCLDYAVFGVAAFD